MNHNRAIAGIIQELDEILDRLQLPEELDADQLAALMSAWDQGMARLEPFTQRFPDGVAPGDGTRERLTRLVKRIQEIQPLLMRHKSEVADQLFSENRRVQALRRGYDAVVRDSGLFHHRA